MPEPIVRAFGVLKKCAAKVTYYTLKGFGDFASKRCRFGLVMTDELIDFR